MFNPIDMIEQFIRNNGGKASHKEIVKFLKSKFPLLTKLELELFMQEAIIDRRFRMLGVDWGVYPPDFNIE